MKYDLTTYQCWLKLSGVKKPKAILRLLIASWMVALCTNTYGAFFTTNPIGLKILCFIFVVWSIFAIRHWWKMNTLRKRMERTYSNSQENV